MMPNFRHSRREVTKRKFDLGSFIPKPKVVISTKVSPLASFAVSVPQNTSKGPQTPSSLRKLAESLGSSPLAAIIEQNDDNQVTPVQDHDSRTGLDRLWSSTPKPGKEAANRRRPVFYTEKPTTPIGDPDLSRISRHGGGVATITTANSKKARHINVSIDEEEGNQTLTLEAPSVVSSSVKKGKKDLLKTKINSSKVQEKNNKNQSVVKSVKTKNTKSKNNKNRSESVVNSSKSLVKNNQNTSDRNVSKAKVRNNQSNSDKNTLKSLVKNNQNRSNKNVSKSSVRDNKNTPDKNISRSSVRNIENRSVLNTSKASTLNNQNKSTNILKRQDETRSESQKNDTIIVQSQEANNRKSSVNSAKKRKISSDIQTKSRDSSASITKPTQKQSLTGKTKPKSKTVRRRDSSENETDENDDQGDVMMLLWEKDGGKRTKTDFCDVDVVLNTVTELLEEERDLCDYARARKAIKLLEKNLVQDIKSMIDSDQTTRGLQRDIKKSMALLEDKQDTLMDLQLKRIELEEASQGLKEKELSKQNHGVINTFLKDMKKLIAAC